MTAAPAANVTQQLTAEGGVAILVPSAVGGTSVVASTVSYLLGNFS